MLKVNQRFNSVGEMLSAMTPGQRVLVHCVKGEKTRTWGSLMCMGPSTLRNCLSKVNTQAKQQPDVHTFFRLVPYRRVDRKGDDDRVARYGEMIYTPDKRAVARREIVIHSQALSLAELGTADDFMYVECLRFALADTELNRQCNGKRLTNDFFKIIREPTKTSVERVEALAQRLQDSANASIDALGVTELLTTMLYRLPVARMVQGSAYMAPLVQLPLQRRWLAALEKTYALGPRYNKFVDLARLDHMARWGSDARQNGAVREPNTWYADNVWGSGLRWADFGFYITGKSSGNGITYMLESDYATASYAAAMLGIPLTLANKTAAMEKVRLPSVTLDKMVGLLNAAEVIDTANQPLALVYVSPAIENVEFLPTAITNRRLGGMSRRIHAVKFVVPGTLRAVEREVAAGQGYYVSIITNMDLDGIDSTALCIEALDRWYDAWKRNALGLGPVTMLIKAPLIDEKGTPSVKYRPVSGLVKDVAERAVVPYTGPDTGQPFDSVWIEGGREDLTVPTKMRLTQAWAGVGNWCKVDGKIVRRAVFFMPPHPDAVSDKEFEAEVRHDLQCRGIPWPWGAQS